MCTRDHVRVDGRHVPDCARAPDGPAPLLHGRGPHEDIRERWNYPELTERDKRLILGLNSARLYGLTGKEVRAVGQCGSAYNPVPADYPSRIPDSLNALMFGVGYPTPVVPVTTMNLPNDNFTKARRQYAEMGGLRSNERHGW